MKDYSDWMKDAMKEDEHMDEFDLATECCSVHGLWEDDMSIPAELVEQAKKFFP